MPSDTVQNYLKAIYQLGDGGEQAVPLGELARELNVTPGTATLMVQRLDEDSGLVDYRKRAGASLTDEGLREALSVLRRHRLIESFLVEKLGLGWEEVHDEAERLEHAMSERLVERLAELLGHPEYDPHGTPIPAADGEMPADLRLALSETAPGDYLVVGYRDPDDQLVALCRDRGLGHGTPLRVLECDPAADCVRVATSAPSHPGAPAATSHPVSLGGSVARRILVRERGA